MANQFTTPFPQFMNATPEVYAGGKLYFYVTGTTTETDTFTNAALSTPNTNPVILDSAGKPATRIFLDPDVTYKVVLTDADDAVIWTADPVTDPAANVVAAIEVYSGNPTGNVAGNAGTVGGVGASMVWNTDDNLMYVCTTTGDASSAVWTQVGANLSGAVAQTGIITPTSLGANQNNYNPTSLASASVIRQNCSTAVQITGLDGGSTGRLIEIHNISTTVGATITLVSESSNSDADNRFLLNGDLVIYGGQSATLWYDATSARWRVIGSQMMASGASPGGRLVLTSNPATVNVTGATTIFYTPYLSSYVPLYNGTAWYLAAISELSQTLSDSSKSPAATIADSLYDMFVWNDSGTIRCTRGPAWTDATTRSAGTELVRQDGRWVNSVAITNGPAAKRGLYVGTIATDSANTLNMNKQPTAASGGTDNRLDVWNMYNRVMTAAICRPSDNSWNYTTATWRAVNASNSMRITYVVGLGMTEDALLASYGGVATSGDAINARVGVGVDSTSAFSGRPGIIILPNTSLQAGAVAEYFGNPGLGRHYIQALEHSDATGTTVWYGDNGAPTTIQTALQFALPM